MKFEKYTKNLKLEGVKVYSYDTHVANIDKLKCTISCLGYWSQTTSKHINYVAKILELQVIKCYL